MTDDTPTPAETPTSKNRKAGHQMWIQWVLRIAGYALTVGSTFAAQKWGADVGGPMAAVGGVLLNKASSTVIPKKPIP